MRKKGLFLGVLASLVMCLNMPVLAAEEIAVDETNFPDAGFRTYITYISEMVDLDTNGELSEEEIIQH